MLLKRFLASLHAHDITVIVFAAFLSVINLAFHERIPEWRLLILANVFVSVGVVALAYFDSQFSRPVLSFIHFWYVAPVVLLTFKELYLMIYPIHGRDYDGLFVAIDRWLFGADPTVWLAQIAHPVLTEILQIAYSSFYFLLIIIGYELYRRGEPPVFLYYAFLVLYGFYLSYIGYFFLPAVGPRFTLHDFNALNDELPGLLLTNLLRDFVNWGESIPVGVSNPLEYAQRDVFPSGHTMMMLVMMHVAVKYGMKVKWFILVAGTLLIIGTVYLRYHYVIDVVAGILFYVLCIWSSPWLFNRWEKVREKLSQ